MDEETREQIREAYAHVGAAVIQTLPSDDKIIAEHIQAAHDILRGLLITEARKEAA